MTRWAAEVTGCVGAASSHREADYSYCNRQRGHPPQFRLHGKRLSWRDTPIQTHTYTKSASTTPRESFLVHMIGGAGGLETQIGQEISRALHPVGLPSHQTCCRCHPRWRRLSFCWKERREVVKKKNLVDYVEDSTQSL